MVIVSGGDDAADKEPTMNADRYSRYSRYNRYNPSALPTHVRVFRSTGAAYDACQTDETIEDGTVLLIPSEQVVAIAWAWPVAVTGEAGHLHTLEGDSCTTRLDPEIHEAVPRAAALAASLGWDRCSFASMIADEYR